MAASTFPLPTGDLPLDVAYPTGFLHTLLTISLTGVAVLRPLYAGDEETIRDFAWVSLNPAGQQLLGQPTCPADSLLALFPKVRAYGGFVKYGQSFTTGELTRHHTSYQADGVDGYFLTVAQRYENVLLLNFIATNEQHRSEVEEALRASQEARERVTSAATERERQRLQDLIAQVPVAISLFEGEEVRMTAVNAGLTDILGYSAEHLLGRPLLEAMPALAGQGFDDVLRQVLHTHQPVVGQAVPATIKRRGEMVQTYHNVI